MWLTSDCGYFKLLKIMRRLTRFTAVWLFAVLTLQPATAWAGAWTLPRNRWYIEYFYRYFYSKHIFDSEGNSGRRPTNGFFSDIRNELKLEYGLTDWWTLMASAPYLSSHYRDDNIDLLRTGIQDVYVRNKFRFFNRPVISSRSPMVASAQFSVKIPTYYVEENPLGDGQWDVESRLQVSQAWLFGPETPPHLLAPASRQDWREQETLRRPASREEAIRDSVLEAEMLQRGSRLYEEGEFEEAAKWFQAVLVSNPSNHEIQRIVLNHAAQVMTAEAARRGEPVPVASEYLEPMRYEDPAGDPLRSPQYTKIAFINAEGAFTARDGPPANEFPTYVEAGFTPFKRLMLIGSLDSIVSLNTIDEDEENFSKWGIRGVFNLTGDGFASIFKSGGPTVNLEVGYNDVFEGRNTADAFEVFTKLGIFF